MATAGEAHNSHRRNISIHNQCAKHEMLVLCYPREPGSDRAGLSCRYEDRLIGFVSLIHIVVWIPFFGDILGCNAISNRHHCM